MRLFTYLTILCFSSVSVYAADSVEERYQSVKEQTQHTGSAGFDARHKAYSQYIMQNRKAEEAGFADIEPAAGDEDSADVSPVNKSNNE